jgi:hypothetical protein
MTESHYNTKSDISIKNDDIIDSNANAGSGKNAKTYANTKSDEKSSH